MQLWQAWILCYTIRLIAYLYLGFQRLDRAGPIAYQTKPQLPHKLSMC